MDKELYDALVDLKRSLDKQIEVQEASNALMRAMIGALEETGQAVADLKQELDGKRR